MEDNGSFVDQLEAALEQKRRELESTALPAVREKVQAMRGAFQGLYNLLVRKSLINEDPYKYDQKLSEIVVPDTSPIMEHEKTDKLGIRLAQFDLQLEFLSNYYQFTTEYLNLARVKLLAKLIKVVDWDKMSESSTHPNTRALADQLVKIRGGSDKFAIQLVNDAQNQMALASREILAHLRGLTLYHRESYKLALRKNVPAVADLTEENVSSGLSNAIDTVKKSFGKTMPGSPFYNDLVTEVLKEDYLPEGEGLRADVLRSLAVREKKQRRTQQVSFKSTLIEALRMLSTAGRHIEAAVMKLDEGSRFVEERKHKAGSPLKRWLYKMVYGKREERTYEVEFLDVSTSVSRSKKLNFDAFYEEAMRTARILTAYSSKQGSAQAKIQALDEDGLYQVVERQSTEVQKLAKTMPALFTALQSELQREDRGRLKGIKMEVNAVQNAIVKSNQRRHEYISRKEEERQLKKLGVDVDTS